MPSADNSLISESIYNICLAGLVAIARAIGSRSSDFVESLSHSVVVCFVNYRFIELGGKMDAALGPSDRHECICGAVQSSAK